MLVLLLLFAALRVGAVSFRTTLTKGTSPFVVNFKIENLDTAPLKFVRFNTPFDQKSDGTLMSDVFTLKRNGGGSAVYTGTTSKRAIKASNMVTIAPGKSMTASVNLLKSYRFPSAGTYQLSLTVNSLSVALNGGNKQSFTFSTQSLTYTVTAANVRAAPRRFAPPAGTFTNADCSTADFEFALQAVAQAPTLVETVNNYLASGSCPLPEYTKWLGACGAGVDGVGRFQEVKTHFIAIANALSAGGILNCSRIDCGPTTFAFVYPDDTAHEIHLCQAFFDAPNTLCTIDSAPGTIIHELSHFDDVAGTNDFAYGPDDVQALAITTPNQAYRNADSHEYLAESCPTVGTTAPATSYPPTSYPPTPTSYPPTQKPGYPVPKANPKSQAKKSLHHRKHTN